MFLKKITAFLLGSMIAVSIGCGVTESNCMDDFVQCSADVQQSCRPDWTECRDNQNKACQDNYSTCRAAAE